MEDLLYGLIFLAIFIGPFILAFLRNLSGTGKKILIGVILAILIFAIGLPTFTSWVSESNDNPFDYARITHVDYKAVVTDEPGGDGKAVITEVLTFDIHAASSTPDGLFWELWRDLPEAYYDGVLVNYNVKSVKQVLDDGTRVAWEEAPKLYWDDRDFTSAAISDGLGPGKWFHSEGPYDEYYRQYECLLFYVDGLYRETITFEIEYEMYNAALRYGDSSELYLAMWSGPSSKYLESFNADILFPENKMPRTGNYEAYTYGTNSHTFPFVQSTEKYPGYHTFSFSLDRSQLRFRPYNQYIEFALLAFGEDKHIFTEHASAYNWYYNENMLEDSRREQAVYEALPAKYFTSKVILSACLTAAAALLIWIVSGTDRRMRKKHTFFKPEAEIEYFRDIPSDLDPNFAATLVFCKHKLPSNASDDGYSAVMLSLERKGYVTLDRMWANKGWEPDNMKLIVKYRPAQPAVQQAPAVQSHVVYCTSCGGYNTSDSMFCTGCGAGIQHPKPQMPPQPVYQESAKQYEIPKAALTPTEELYFNLILRHTQHGDEISLKEFQEKVKRDYQYTSSFVTNVKTAIARIGQAGGFFRPNYKLPANNVKAASVFLAIVGTLILLIGNLVSYQTRMDLAFGAYFILGLGFIGSSVYLMKIAGRYYLLTQFGESEYAKWRGLYNFLNSNTLMSERIVPELVLWEKFLVYATAFGISEKVIKALEVKCAEMGVNMNNSPVFRNRYYRSRYFYRSHAYHSFGRSFSGAARSAVSHSYTSGGHGGYGGGGRGGGGGGGGH